MYYPTNYLELKEEFIREVMRQPENSVALCLHRAPLRLRRHLNEALSRWWAPYMLRHTTAVCRRAPP